MDDFVWASLALMMALISLTGSYLVIHQIYKRQDAMLAHHGPLINAIFWMCMMDFCFSIWIIVLYTPQLWGDVIYQDGNEVRSAFCVILGFWGQFVSAASLSWYFMIAIMTFALLVGKSTEFVRATVRIQHLYVWSTSAAGSLVLLFNGALGADTQIDEGPPVECWLSKDQNQNGLYLYVPMAIYMTISLVLLAFALYKSRIFKSSRRVLRRMFCFVFGYIFIWGVPLVDRYRLMITGDEPPEPLAFVHWACLALSGFANAIIWISTKPTAKQMLDESSTSSEEEEEDTQPLPDETATENRGSDSWSLPPSNVKSKKKKSKNRSGGIPSGNGTLNGTEAANLLSTTDSFILEEKAPPGQRTPLKLHNHPNNNEYARSPAQRGLGRSPINRAHSPAQGGVRTPNRGRSPLGRGGHFNRSFAKWDRGRRRSSSDCIAVGEMTPLSSPRDSDLREQLLRRDAQEARDERDERDERDQNRIRETISEDSQCSEKSREQQEIFPESV